MVRVVNVYINISNVGNESRSSGPNKIRVLNNYAYMI